MILRFAQYSDTPQSSVRRRNTGKVPLEGELSLHEVLQPKLDCIGANLSGQPRECGCMLHAHISK